MKPGEDKRFVTLKAENMDKFFSGFFSKLVKSNEDLKKPLGDMMVRWIDEVVGKDKETPYKTRTGTIQDLHCETHYRSLVSINVELKDQKGIK